MCGHMSSKDTKPSLGGVGGRHLRGGDTLAENCRASIEINQMKRGRVFQEMKQQI